MTNEIISKIQHILAKNITDENELLEQLHYIIDKYEVQQTDAFKSMSMQELLGNVIKALDTQTLSQSVLKTGYNNFNLLANGLVLGEVVVFAGRPSMGKTSFLINLLLKMKDIMPVLYCSFDLSGAALASRFLSSKTEIPIDKILQHNLSDEDKLKMIDAKSQLEEYNIHIADVTPYPFRCFKDFCIKKLQEEGIKILVIDYLQLMGSQIGKYSRDSEISYYMRAFKNMAKEMNVCVIIVSQLSRAVEVRGGRKRPILSDLRDSGSIEQDADKIFFLYREEYYGIFEDEYGNSTLNTLELILAKNRIGPTGSLMFKRNDDFTNIFWTLENEDSKDFNFLSSHINDIDDIDNTEPPF